MRYLIVVQPADNSGDHWVSAPDAKGADKFARWIHRATGAAVAVHDWKHDRDRLTLGAFDRERV